ncbi:MAG: hypothetical protein EBR53_08825, partial [Actinobacteria bacterium]|nr:hypothetical protein [Actinomycetota bacterium]
MAMSVLVIDVGTTGLRAAVVGGDGKVAHLNYELCSPNSPFPGLVEFDALTMRDAVLRVASKSLSQAGKVDAVGITTQRASTVVWDAKTGLPIGPSLSWQDLRTVGECITAKIEHNLTLAPNQTATKAAWMLKNYTIPQGADIRIGTVDTWIASVLSNGTLHVTDHSNAAVTGLLDP